MTQGFNEAIIFFISQVVLVTYFIYAFKYVREKKYRK